MKIAQRLTNHGFTYDAPPNFILSLGPLPDLKAPESGYSDYLRGRARTGMFLWRSSGEKNLEDFRKALIDLAEESNFIEFFNQNRINYQKYLEESMTDFGPIEKIRVAK
ncbi:hypothetical protein [Natronospora cellulosivora (SeqCode)]